MNNEAPVFSFMNGQDIELDSMHPTRILHHIFENIENSKEYLYLVTGKIGVPTGKTWLYNGLKLHGYNAIEITEDICEYVIYRYTNKNRYYVNPRKKLVIIVLNEILEQFI